MKTVTVEKQKKLSDSEQTIAEIRALRWELSKKIKTYEDVKKLEKEVDEEMCALRIQLKKQV